MKLANWGKIVGLSAAFIATAALAAGLQKGGSYPVVTPEQHKAALEEQQRNIDAMLARDALLKTPSCDDPIIVTIADLTLRMPRYGEFILSNGKPLTYINHRCDIKRLDNVRSISFSGINLTDRRTMPADFQSSYKRLIPYIKEGHKKNSVTMLSNGIERVKHGFWYIYVASNKLIPTYDDKYVAFDCSVGTDYPNEAGLTDSCIVRYPYNSSLDLSYRFFRKEYPDENYVKADQNKRKTIEQFIIKGSQR